MKTFATLALSGLLLLPSLAHAQSGTLRGWGPRVGLSSDPDQIYLGTHFDLGNLANRLRFQPNLELGVGDGLTVLTTNFEVGYRLRTDWDVWSPYVGGGLGVVTVGSDDGIFDDRYGSELGATGLFGVERVQGSNRFFLEAKVGLVDAPDLKLGMGWTFY